MEAADPLTPGAGIDANGPLGRREARWRTAAGKIAASNSPVADLACRQGLVVGRGQARDAGITDALVRARVRRDEWSIPRRGTLCLLTNTDPADDVSPHGPEMAATAAALLRPGTVISHASATSVHGLPLLSPVARPVLTGPSATRACSWDGIRIHAAAMTRGEVDRWFGAPVTSVARTVIDLARDRGLADGLVAADAALREGLTTRAELAYLLERQRGWPGVRAARRMVDLADGNAESALETLTRLCVIEAGLPLPELQVSVVVDGFRYRTDMMWPSVGLILEADGWAKYSGNFAVLSREKRRQERLENAGYRVIRVSWEDVVRRPVETAARIRAALASCGYWS